MNCCGKKRRDWLEKSNSHSNLTNGKSNLNSFVSEKPKRVFEYIGKNSLSIRGAVSGKIYQFKYFGHQLEVNHYDSLALMAERDLRVVRLVEN